MPTLGRIIIYPIKSLDGVCVRQARVLANGALEHDRRFALVDGQGRYFNGKRSAAVHLLRAGFDLQKMVVDLQPQVRSQGQSGASFDLNQDRAALEAWISDFFKQPLRLVEKITGGWPDDTDAAGPTVIGRGTIEQVADWFDLSPDETRRRFRANLELDTAKPFWEDRLFGETGQVIPFAIGASHFVGVNPCQRCVVPSRSTDSGEITPNFAKRFAELRERSLPASTTRSRFDHFFRLAVNTRGAGNGSSVVQVGDDVKLD